MQCENCGAVAVRGDGRFCGFCGARFPDVPRITPEEWRTHPERFAHARTDPGFERAMTAEPEPLPDLPGVGFSWAPGVLFAVSIVPIVAVSGAPASFVAIGAAMAALSVVGSLAMGKGISNRWEAVRNAPVTRHLAVVLDERVEVYGGGGESPTSTQYYASLAFEDGTRSEYAVTAEVAGAMVPGDIGVVLFRGAQAIAFSRLER